MKSIEMTNGRLVEVEATTLYDWIVAGKATLVDVREPAEYAEQRIPGSVSIPLSSFDADRLPDAENGRIVLICAIGRRSLKAAGLLHMAGHEEVVHLYGGVTAWEAAGLPTVSDDAELKGKAA